MFSEHLLQGTRLGGCLKNTLSTWVKNKVKIFKAYKAGHVKQQKLKTAEFGNINTATHK